MMWHRHVGKDLVAFCEGELEVKLANQIEEHLRVCRRCHKEYEQVSRGVFLARHLSRPARSTLSWSEVERAITDGHDRTGQQVFDTTGRISSSWLGPTIFAATCLTLVLIGSFLFRSRRHGVNLDTYLSRVETAASGHSGEAILAAPPGFRAADEQTALRAAGVERVAAQPPLAGYSLVQQSVLRMGSEDAAQLGYGNGSEFFSVFVAPRKVPFSFGKREIESVELYGIQCNEVSCPRTSTVLFSAKRFHCVLVARSQDKKTLATIVRYFLSAHDAWRPS
jgi:anti-sigma factor RsiW